MEIESIIRRKKGSHVSIDGVEYHFAPSEKHGGKHVAEVENPEHIERLLSVPEGFRAIEPAKSKPAEPTKKAGVADDAPAIDADGSNDPETENFAQDNEGDAQPAEQAPRRRGRKKPEGE